MKATYPHTLEIHSLHIKTLNRPHNTLNTHTTTKQNTSTSSYRYSTYLRNHIATWGGLGPGKSGWVLPAMTTTMATLWEVSCENRSSCDDCASSTKVSDCRMILHLPSSTLIALFKKVSPSISPFVSVNITTKMHGQRQNTFKQMFHCLQQ